MNTPDFGLELPEKVRLASSELELAALKYASDIEANRRGAGLYELRCAARRFDEVMRHWAIDSKGRCDADMANQITFLWCRENREVIDSSGF